MKKLIQSMHEAHETFWIVSGPGLRP